MSYAREPRASDPFRTSEPIPAGNGLQSRAPGLPTARAFLTALFDSLRAHPHPHTSQGRGTSASATARPSAANAEDGASNDAPNVLGAAPATSTTVNVLVNAPDAVRKALLTLHVLFPNELLPALDLLDRRLVMRFRVRREEGVRGTGGTQGTRDGAVVGVGDGERDGRHAGRGVGCVLPDDAYKMNVRNTEDARSTGKAQAMGATSASAPASASASMSMSAPNPATSASTSGHNTAHATTTGAGSGLSSSSGPAIGIPDADPDIAQKPPVDSFEDETVHHVRSAQHRPSRYTTSYDSTTSYQVRLRAWNCSCPAFVFSAFPSTLSDPAIPQMQIGLGELDTLLWGAGGVSPTPATATQKYAEEDSGNGDINGSLGKVIGKSGTDAQSWQFGGESIAEEIGMSPVCKHLLACVLVERCGIFAGFVEERVIGAKEAAGWAAGWGD